jgi:hypothetical protein
MRRYTVAASFFGLAVLVGLDPGSGLAGSADAHTIHPSLTATGASVPTSTVLTSDRNPAMFGELVHLRAQVTSAGGTPTGTVDVVDGVTTICEGVALDADGLASCEVQLLPDAHPLTAFYSGDPTFETSSSAPLAQTVRAPRTTVDAGTIDTG